MKRILLALIAVMAFGLLHAQSLQLFKDGAAVPHGSELTVVNSPDHDPAELILTVLNNSTSAMDVLVRKTDLDLVSGTNSNICWGVNCFPPFVYETPESVRLSPGETNESFRGDYTHGGAEGTSTVLFSFFDASNPADSTSVFVHFVVATTLENSFELTYNGNVIANDTEITLQYEPSHDPAEIPVLVKNINSVPVSAKFRKYDIGLLNLTSSNICWGPACYPPFVFDTPDAVSINPGETDATFRGDYTHGGVQGTSAVVFTIYNVDNPNDTVSFKVNFIIGYLGVDKPLAKTARLSNAYPNPATGSTVIDYTLPAGTTSASIRISNLLGNEMREYQLGNSEGKVTVDVSSLSNGVYFYTLTVNNSAVSTRKFVVNR
jgi:hypothetical protein